MNTPMNTPAMNPITEDDIADFLLNTPDFFGRHAELLSAVLLTSPHGNRAVSLQERQAEMLREKIRILERRVMDMIRHGNENVIIADRLQRWTSELLRTRDARDLPLVAAREIATQCRGGLLRHTELKTESFRETGNWADRRKSRPYNLFYGDIEADVQARMVVWKAGQPA